MFHILLPNSLAQSQQLLQYSWVLSSGKKNHLRLIIKNIFDHQIDMNGQWVLCWMNHSCSQISKQQKDIFLILPKLPQNSSFAAERIEEIWNWGQTWRQMSHGRELCCWGVVWGTCLNRTAEGDFGHRQTLLPWFHPCLITDWASQNQRLGVYPRFKPKHRCCCNAIPAGAEALGTGLGVGLRTHALLSMSHTRFTAEEEKRCFMLSGSGAECCSLPSAVLLLKTSQGLGMMEFHADIYIQELSVSSCAWKGSISKL